MPMPRNTRREREKKMEEEPHGTGTISSNSCVINVPLIICYDKRSVGVHMIASSMDQPCIRMWHIFCMDIKCTSTGIWLDGVIFFFKFCR